MSSGCGCKEVYRFPHISYPYSSCICSFFAAASLHLSCFSFLFQYICVIYLIIFLRSINTKGRLRASHGSRMKVFT